MKRQKYYKILGKQASVTYSKNDYVKLGDKLRKCNNIDDISLDDLEILQIFRTSYQDDLSDIFRTLYESTQKIDKSAIVTYRIKRIESIISKLKRLEKAQLPRIEDIAGCRCILKSNEQVYKLKDILNDQLFIKSDRNDYIANPKEDGYRSLHLIVQNKERTSKTIEVQLRCEKDHNWATLVEITDQIYNTKIKERGVYDTKIKERGDDDHQLGQMLLLLSKGINSLTKYQLDKLIDIIKKKDFIPRLSLVFYHNHINIRKQWTQINKQKGNDFFLIQVDKKNYSKISNFSRFEDAEKKYFEQYKNNPSHNIVLTHIPNAKFDQVEKAYSNYILTYHSFIKELDNKIQEICILAFNSYKVMRFLYLCELLLLIYFENYKFQRLEQLELTKTKCNNVRKHEWKDDLEKRYLSNIIDKAYFFKKLKLKKYNLYHRYIIFKINKICKTHLNLFRSCLF